MWAHMYMHMFYVSKGIKCNMCLAHGFVMHTCASKCY